MGKGVSWGCMEYPLSMPKYLSSSNSILATFCACFVPVSPYKSCVFCTSWLVHGLAGSWAVAPELSTIPHSCIKEAASSIHRPRKRLNGKIKPRFCVYSTKRGSECQLRGNYLKKMLECGFCVFAAVIDQPVMFEVVKVFGSPVKPLMSVYA